MFKFRFGVPLPLLLVVICALVCPVASRADMRPTFVPGEVLVKFRSGSAATMRSSAISAMGHSRLQSLDKGSLLQRVKIREGQDPLAIAKAYRGNSQIEWAEPNYISYVNALPDDPDFGQLWGLKNTGQTVENEAWPIANPGTAGRDMNLESAWDHITDCSSVVVAVVDTGVNYTHQDLAANMWDGGVAYPNHGYDFVDEDNDPMPPDGSGHGTHVAGTIGAVGNNALGGTGVCWSVQIMAVRAGSGRSLTHADIYQSILFAVDQGAHVINMSFGGPDSETIASALAYAHDAGVLLIASAGNSAEDNDVTPQYPCASDLDNLVCVAALNQDYGLASFSSYGLTTVDVGAPGTNIFSTIPGPVIEDDFSGGWTRTGDWSVVDCDLGAGPLPTLADPADACSGGSYANSADHRAYKTFDLSGYLGAGVMFKTFLQVESGYDYLNVGLSATGADPFADGTLIGSYSGSTYGSSVWLAHDLRACLTADCAFGFQLTSDGSITGAGVAIQRLAIETTEVEALAQNVYNGTSMATPHVVGLAALIWAANPDYTYGDVIQAIYNSGDSVAALEGKTVTGKAVDAMGSLRHIQPPTGLSASLP